MKKESGNALWFILIAIGLLALLTVSLTRGGSSSNETGNFEQNQIVASEILTYAKSIENAVQSLLARGCSENEISFENNIVAGYENTTAPRTDKSCHVFDVDGAGLTYEAPKTKWLDSTHSAEAEYRNILFVGTNQVKNLRNDSRDDLLFMVNWLSNDVCAAINRTIFSDSTITEDLSDFDMTKFNGGFDTEVDTIDLSATPAHDGAMSACFTSQTSGGNHFYHAIHPR